MIPFAMAHGGWFFCYFLHFLYCDSFSKKRTPFSLSSVYEQSKTTNNVVVVLDKLH